MAKAMTKSEKYADQLRRFALEFPGTHEDDPWGEIVVKAAQKVFIFTGKGTGGVGLSVKLSESQFDALEFPFCDPTGYGLGKHGWVSARFGAKDSIPIDMLMAWITESYRNVAPKKLVKEWDAGRAAGPAKLASKVTAPRPKGTKATKAVAPKSKAKAPKKTAKKARKS